jgi:hypothetical protein
MIWVMGGMDMPESFDDLEKWRNTITPFLVSKLEEFHLLGVDHLKLDEFWKFAKEAIGRNKEERPERIHEIVAAVMSLTVNDYMNKLRRDIFKEGASDANRSLFK